MALQYELVKTVKALLYINLIRKRQVRLGRHAIEGGELVG